MNEFVLNHRKIMIDHTIKNLVKNNYAAYFLEKKADIIPFISTLCNEFETVSCGGSETLKETGVFDHLKSGRYHFLNREETGADPDYVMHQALLCDTFFSSVNAITQDGRLYNVDATGNRVAALVFGPKSVIIIAGYNKIVTDISAAEKRVREKVAPVLALRKKAKTPCVNTGVCYDCSSPDKVCGDFAIMGRQREQGRVKVIIIGEELGL